MLKMEYFNFRLLLGMLRSKQVSGRWWNHSVYSVNVQGSFKLSTGQGTVLPRGPPCPRLHYLQLVHVMPTPYDTFFFFLLVLCALLATKHVVFTGQFPCLVYEDAVCMLVCCLPGIQTSYMCPLCRVVKHFFGLQSTLVLHDSLLCNM